MAKAYRRGFRPKEVPLLVARNLDKPKGRPLTLGDLTPFARPLHPPCAGRGALGPEVSRSGKREVCRCATDRFLAAHPEVIMDDRGNAWWPAAPEDPSDGGAAA